LERVALPYFLFSFLVQVGLVTALTGIRFRAEPRTTHTRRFEQRLTSADSGLQLDLEIALSGFSSPKAFGVETSGDVIEGVFTSPAKMRQAYFTDSDAPIA
jgi:hypothetical protein